MLQTEDVLTADLVWTVFVHRVEKSLFEQKEKILELCGFYEAFGRPGPGFTGEEEGTNTITELTGFICVALAEDLQARRDRSESKELGRPCDVLTRELGPKLLELFFRYHVAGGRHSVWTSRDGKLVQEESGPLYALFSVALSELNAFLKEQDWKTVSPGRAVRFALAERKRALDAKLKKTHRHAVTEHRSGPLTMHV